MNNIIYYEPNRFSKFAWWVYSWDNWLFCIVFVIVIFALIGLYKKYITKMSSKFSIFSWFLNGFQFVFVLLIAFTIGFGIHVKLLTPHDNLQKLMWFQTNYPDFRQNAILTACKEEYAVKLFQAPQSTNMFVDEMSICLRGKSGTLFNAQALQDERAQNTTLLQQNMTAPTTPPTMLGNVGKSKKKGK